MSRTVHIWNRTPSSSSTTVILFAKGVALHDLDSASLALGILPKLDHLLATKRAGHDAK